MQLSTDTLQVLKNFAQINGNLTIEPGNVLKTISVMRDTFATARVAEEFAVPFYLYDLGNFLATISLCEEPELDFTPDYVRITDNKDVNVQMTYWSSSPDSVMKIPNLKQLPEALAEFTLTASSIKRISKAAGVLMVSDVVISGKDGKITAVVCDVSGANKNQMAINLSNDYVGVDFSVRIDNKKLIMIGGDYQCRIIGEQMLQAINTEKPVEYLFALAVMPKN